MKVKGLIRLTAVFLLLALCLSACTPPTPDPNAGKLKVMVSLGEGATVDGTNPKYVNSGDSVNFKIIIDEDYILSSVSHGVYDAETQVLAVDGITANTNIDFSTRKKLDYTLTLELDEGISCAEGTSLTVREGDAKTLTLTAAPGYVIDKVTGGSFDKPTGKLTVPPVLQNTTVRVTAIKQQELNVTVNTDEGATVEGESSKTVITGDSVSFKINVKEGYLFASVSGGSFDQATGILTLDNVTESTTVQFVTEKSNIDVTETVRYSFTSVSDKDTTSVVGGSYAAGTVITVTAGDLTRGFEGWVVMGKGTVSTERSYTFRLTEQTVIKASYKDIDTLVYDANGGQINTTSKNLSRSDYYTVTVKGSRVSVKPTKEYLDYIECASSFYDDSSFTREGYILKEYNTKADGTGEGYSLGSKIALLPINEDNPVLYCIWAKATDGGDFTTEDFSLALPDKVTAEKAPHWVSEGVIIKGYTGDAKEVVIPEKIGGKTVIAIGEGAFTNKSLETLVMGKNILTVKNGAFKNCSSLKTVYYPDSMYEMYNEALDEASYAKLEHIYVNATLAPRYTKGFAYFAVKLSRLLASEQENRIVVIAGSSAYQGLGTAYLEALFDGKYRVVNFGTTRTTHGMMYLEAMQTLAHEGDIILYAPENSSYMLGENELYEKTLRDLEGMVNIYRYVDMRNYSNFFSAFTAFNKTDRYPRAIQNYEEICKVTAQDKYGDFHNEARTGVSPSYYDAYFVTMNERIKSKDEGEWNDVDNQHANKDYTDLNNKTWCSLTEDRFVSLMNHAVGKAQESGATVMFSFSPVDASKLVEGADTAAWLAAYDKLIADTYDFDGVLGRSQDYIFDHKYFYDNAFHLNDIGRAYRTYRLYCDLAARLGITEVNGFTSKGTSFKGVIFEQGSTGAPLTPWAAK